MTGKILLQSGKFTDYALAASPTDTSLWLKELDPEDVYQQWTQEGSDAQFRMRNAGSGRVLEFSGGNEQPVVLAQDSDVPGNTGWFSWGGREGWGARALQSFLDSGQNVDAMSADGDTPTTAPVRTRGWRHGFQRELTYFTLPVATVADSVKLELITRYAPRIYLSSSESFYPSSLDWAFQYLTRFKDDDGRYWLETTQALSSPEDTSLALFKGQKDLSQVPVYAFWVAKESSFDIAYFAYFPFNLGKGSPPLLLGNHVSDWEHMTVRLDLQGNPVGVCYEAHGEGSVYLWGAVEKEGDHPVGYAAQGSHGLWSTSGVHFYEGPLADVCDRGKSWDTWNRIEAWDASLRRGLGSSSWPAWMSTDYGSPGPNPSSPTSGPIYRWGNSAAGCFWKLPCQLEDGPTGPIDHEEIWSPGLFA